MAHGNDMADGSADDPLDGAASRGAPRPVGVGVRPLALLATEVQAVVAGFDSELTLARDCLDLVSVFTDLEHAASAGLALAARRVAQTDLWEHRGHGTSAHWLAAKTGMTVGDAMRLLETAAVAEGAPTTMDALKKGDGSSWARVIGPTADVARLEAALKPLLDDIFQDARQEGRREPVGAYAFDALMGLADRRRAEPRNGADSSRGSSKSSTSGGVDRYRFAKVIVRADLAALDRGATEPGEVCEVAGHGPIPVSDAWKIIDGGASIAGIVNQGTEIVRVRHLGRRPSLVSPPHDTRARRVHHPGRHRCPADIAPSVCRGADRGGRSLAPSRSGESGELVGGAATLAYAGRYAQAVVGGPGQRHAGSGSGQLVAPGLHSAEMAGAELG